MAKLTPLSEKSVVGLLEGLSRRSTKKFTPFCCAKRSILPSKAETSEKAVRSFYGQNSAAQSHKIG